MIGGPSADQRVGSVLQAKTHKFSCRPIDVLSAIEVGDSKHLGEWSPHDAKGLLPCLFFEL